MTVGGEGPVARSSVSEKRERKVDFETEKNKTASVATLTGVRFDQEMFEPVSHLYFFPK